jgi:hypothetical protein
MSYWSGVNGEGEHASAMMKQAKRFLPKRVPTRIASWFAVFEGTVYSKAGDTPHTLAALERAEESLSYRPCRFQPWIKTCVTLATCQVDGVRFLSPI